jgi:hypothetical protein
MPKTKPRLSILPDDPEVGLGYGPFKVTDRVFERAGSVHDQRYGQHETGDEFEPYTRKRADQEMLRNMLRLSGNDRSKRFRSYIYYGIVRTFGWLFW